MIIKAGGKASNGIRSISVHFAFILSLKISGYPITQKVSCLAVIPRAPPARWSSGARRSDQTGRGAPPLPLETSGRRAQVGQGPEHSRDNAIISMLLRVAIQRFFLNLSRYKIQMKIINLVKSTCRTLSMTAMSCCRLLYVPPVDFCLTLRFRRLFFRGFPDFVFVVLLALVLALRLVVFRLVLRFFLIPAFDPKN